MAGHTRDIARFAGAVLIGRGGFGSVYRATDVEHGRDVAIKVLQGALGETERRRFDRERQTMGRLGAHPNIIPVHESGYTDQGEAYLVMELAAHGSLRDRLDRDGTIPWQEAVSIITAIAGATQAAHEQGVLHRDIKPDNILIDAYHNPRLGDFGIAAVASNATATTSTTATLAHAAPEILQGAQSTAAADIYAIGSTLYNLMTGWPPFQRPGDENVTALITRALTEPPPDLRVQGVPDSVARVVERALAKDIGARQASAAQLAQELADAAANPSAPPLGAPPMPIVSNSETIISGPPMHAGHQGTLDTPQRSIPAAGAGTGAAAAAAAGQGVADGVTMTSPPQPSPQFSPPAAYHAGAGAGAPHGYAAAARPGSGRLWWIVAAVAFIALAGAAGAFAATRSGSGNATGGGAIAGGGTTEPTIDTTTSSDPAAEGTTSTSTTVASTTTAAPTTTTAPSTTTSTSTTADPGPCATVVVDTRTPTFNVLMCASSSGALTYFGSNRTNTDSIELPACFAGGGLFVAENNGFTYWVDTGASQLQVLDPGGALVVDEAFTSPVVPDLSGGANAC